MAASGIVGEAASEQLRLGAASKMLIVLSLGDFRKAIILSLSTMLLITSINKRL